MTRRIECDPVAGIVLAAGVSRRMGRNKMLLELNGEPLVRRAAREALAGGLTPVVVVVGYQAPEVAAALTGLDVRTIENPEYAGASSHSIHRGLEALGPAAEAAVLLLGDMVNVDAAMVMAITSVARRTGAPLVVSRFGAVTAPPQLFRRSLFSDLLACHGEGCGKEVVTRHSGDAVFLDWPEDRLRDIDTPEEFSAALRS